jgi:hypothetical protein
MLVVEYKRRALLTGLVVSMRRGLISIIQKFEGGSLYHERQYEYLN